MGTDNFFNFSMYVKYHVAKKVLNPTEFSIISIMNLPAASSGVSLVYIYFIAVSGG